jgi:hypothetical protein
VRLLPNFYRSQQKPSRSGHSEIVHVRTVSSHALPYGRAHGVVNLGGCIGLHPGNTWL